MRLYMERGEIEWTLVQLCGREECFEEERRDVDELEEAISEVEDDSDDECVYGYAGDD